MEGLLGGGVGGWTQMREWEHRVSQRRQPPLPLDLQERRREERDVRLLFCLFAHSANHDTGTHIPTFSPDVALVMATVDSSVVFADGNKDSRPFLLAL